MEHERTKDYLANYLATIKGKSQQPYKRVSISPLRYAGGKSNAVGLILEHLPALKEKKIVSPFFGGGSFELVLAKHLGFQVIGYDIFAILVNFWNQAISNPKELADELERLVPDKEHFDRNRHILLSYWNKVKPATLEYTHGISWNSRKRSGSVLILMSSYRRHIIITICSYPMVPCFSAGPVPSMWMKRNTRIL
jgi:hypothetical protein